MESLSCPFCNINNDEIVLRNDLCYARFDKYPVNKGHLLLITFRHCSDYFETTHEEKISLLDLIERSKEFISKKHNPDGFNIGSNIGEPAGQTVMHFHYHVIPRYIGDVKNPRGGVRGVIPGKMEY